MSSTPAPLATHVAQEATPHGYTYPNTSADQSVLVESGSTRRRRVLAVDSPCHQGIRAYVVERPTVPRAPDRLHARSWADTSGAPRLSSLRQPPVLQPVAPIRRDEYRQPQRHGTQGPLRERSERKPHVNPASRTPATWRHAPGSASPGEMSAWRHERPSPAPRAHGARGTQRKRHAHRKFSARYPTSLGRWDSTDKDRGVIRSTQTDCVERYTRPLLAARRIGQLFHDSGTVAGSLSMRRHQA